jgi:hypothetical protein
VRVRDVSRSPMKQLLSHDATRKIIAREQAGLLPHSPNVASRLFLLGSDHHDHLAPFQTRERLDLAVLADVFLDLLGQVLAQVLV